MSDLGQLVFIVVSIYIGIGLVFWLHAMKKFSVGRARELFPRMSPVLATLSAGVMALVVIVFVWPWVSSGK